MNLPKVTREFLIANKDRTDVDIAAELGVSSVAVGNLYRRSDIERGDNYARCGRRSPIAERITNEYLRKNAHRSNADIGRELHIDASTVAKLYKKRDIAHVGQHRGPQLAQVGEVVARLKAEISVRSYDCKKCERAEECHTKERRGMTLPCESVLSGDDELFYHAAVEHGGFAW